MTDIRTKIIKCAKCGKESQQLVVYSVNYLLGDKESNDELLSYKQKCPYCGYEAFSIDFLSDKLKREEIVKITNEYINDFNKYEKFKIPNELYLDYFKKIEDKFNVYNFEEDDRFVTYGRLDFLKEELSQRLHDENLKKDSPNWKEKRDNRLGAFWDLYDYIRGDRHIASPDVPEGKNFIDTVLANDQYYNDGLICKQERDILIEMIKEFKNTIDGSNVEKKLIFKIEEHDWGLKTIYAWNTKTWYIYDNLMVKYEIKNGENETKIYSHNISDENLKLIIQNIKLAKLDNHVVEASDGEAWSFNQYDDDNVVWERKLGYIYGIDSLETVSNILLDLVRNDSDIFSEEEMEKNDMGLFSKKDKYEIDVKDNTPQIVYGIPDSLRGQWEKEEKQKNENNKYNIPAYDNKAICLYGIPDSRRNKYKDNITPESIDSQRTNGISNTGIDIHQDTNFKMPNYDNITEELIIIHIKNDKNKYLLRLNFANKPAMYELLFADLNNLDGKIISDLFTGIPESYYNQFVRKFYSIISDWNNAYSGESNVEWDIQITNDNNKIFIFGNGGFPSNWNEFIDLISEYEKLFKIKKKIDIEKIQEMEYDRLSLAEIINNRLKDPFEAELVIKYFKDEEKVNDFAGKLLFKDLSKYDDILNEFTKYLSQRTYDLQDAIEINGYTAKKIHELNPQFTPSSVYTFMVLLRSDPTMAEDMIKGEFKINILYLQLLLSMKKINEKIS